MKIEKFTNDDFAKAAPLAAGAWGDFYADERQWFIDAVAEYILRYNYSNPSLALKAVGDDGVIHGGCLPTSMTTRQMSANGARTLSHR